MKSFWRVTIAKTSGGKKIVRFCFQCLTMHKLIKKFVFHIWLITKFDQIFLWTIAIFFKNLPINNFFIGEKFPTFGLEIGSSTCSFQNGGKLCPLHTKWLHHKGRGLLANQLLYLLIIVCSNLKKKDGTKWFHPSHPWS